MVNTQKSFQFIPFIINLAIPLAIGLIGSVFTSGSESIWYMNLQKPSFNPPGWLFGPVWSALYILIGISSYLVWKKRAQIAHLPRVAAVYFIQLLLNLLWSFLFFYAHNIGAALIEIIVLLVVIVINANVFYKIDKTAGLLFIPYFLWVCFATLLTYGFYSIN
jgi:benzodiazapine receptor